jgi:putative FmdB family regulatory protein
MPIYEYFCKKCESKFETLVLDNDEEVCCAECGSTKIEKQFSSFGLKSNDSAFTTSTSPSPDSSGCGCTPVSCGCGAKH